MLFLFLVVLIILDVLGAGFIQSRGENFGAKLAEESILPSTLGHSSQTTG